MELLNLALPLLLACAASWLIVWGVRRYSARGRLMDLPNARSSHTRATPRGGGLGIVAVTLAGLALCYNVQPQLLAYLLAAALIAAVGWADDAYSLSNKVRFGVHLIGALLVIIAGGWIEQVELPFMGTLSLGRFGAPLTLLWLVGVTNIYNFMDGIDGIAGGQAVVAGGAWLLFGLAGSLPVVAWAGLLIAGSTLGFLWHNWSPARIFMGDVGSTFLGFTFAWLGVTATRADPAYALPGVLLLLPFLLDGSLTIIKRLLRRENIFTAHRSHLYQQLVIAGQPHARVALLYSALALLSALAAWLISGN